MVSGCTSCWMGRHDLCENIRYDGNRAVCCEGYDQTRYAVQRPPPGQPRYDPDPLQALMGRATRWRN